MALHSTPEELSVVQLAVEFRVENALVATRSNLDLKQRLLLDEILLAFHNPVVTAFEPPPRLVSIRVHSVPEQKAAARFEAALRSMHVRES